MQSNASDKLNFHWLKINKKCSFRCEIIIFSCEPVANEPSALLWVIICGISLWRFMLDICRWKLETALFIYASAHFQLLSTQSDCDGCWHEQIRRNEIFRYSYTLKENLCPKFCFIFGMGICSSPRSLFIYSPFSKLATSFPLFWHGRAPGIKKKSRNRKQHIEYMCYSCKIMQCMFITLPRLTFLSHYVHNIWST